MIEESKNVQTTPTRTYCKRSRPLPYCIQIVGRPGTGSLPSTIAPPDHPQAVDKSMTCWEEIRRSHLHESPNPMGQLRVVITQHHWAEVFLEVNGQVGRTLVTKASHTVIVDFGCGQYKQPGEGWAPSGLTLP